MQPELEESVRYRTDALSALSESDLAVFDKVLQAVEATLDRRHLLYRNDFDSAAAANDLKPGAEQIFSLSRQLLCGKRFSRFLYNAGSNEYVIRREAAREPTARTLNKCSPQSVLGFLDSRCSLLNLRDEYRCPMSGFVLRH